MPKSYTHFRSPSRVEAQDVINDELPTIKTPILSNARLRLQTQRFEAWKTFQDALSNADFDR